MSRGTTMCSTSLQVFAHEGAPCTTPVLAPAAPRPHFENGQRCSVYISHPSVCSITKLINTFLKSCNCLVRHGRVESARKR
eukprot:scaffold22777_cov67-Phaeocystis_antarctica.AAC.4